MPTNPNDPAVLPILGHLDELRRRVIYVVVYLIAGMIAGLYFAKPFIHLIEIPASGAFTNFVLMQPTEIVAIYFKVALYIGIVLSLPALIYNLWKFIKPAVPQGVNVSLYGWGASVVALFVVGTVFSFKILLPSGYMFLMGLSKEVALPMITLSSYMSLAMSILVIGGFTFEMPVIAALLTRLRIITPRLMMAKWREVVFGLCVIAAVVTPTTDVFNMMIFALPMIALFGVSILVSSVVYKIYVKDASGEPYGN